MPAVDRKPEGRTTIPSVATRSPTTTTACPSCSTTAQPTYLIDPEGKRVKKISGGATTYYIRGADGSVLEELHQ